MAQKELLTSNGSRAAYRVLGFPAPSYTVISTKFDPDTRGMLAIDQLVVPLATPWAPFATFSHTTRVMTDGAVPVMLMLDCDVEYDVAVVGVQIDTVGAVAQPVLPVLPVLVLGLGTVTVTTSVPTFPAASTATMLMRFEPTCRGTDVVQFVNPLATPLRPIALFSHLTCVTATLSDAVPLSVSDDAFIGVRRCARRRDDRRRGPGGVAETRVDGGGVVVVPPVDDVVLERVTSTLSVLGLPAPSYAVISIKFDPATRGMLAIVQLVVPLATPRAPFATFSHTTRVMTDGAVPVMLMLDCVVEYDVAVVGVQIDTVGAVAQPVLPVLPVLVLGLGTVTVTTSVPTFPAASTATMLMRFEPTCRGTDVVQFVNPLATPLRPIALFSHLTCVTATLSDAVPLSVSDDAFIEYVDALVGETIVAVGRVESGVLVDGGGVVVVPPVDDVVLERVTSTCRYSDCRRHCTR